MSDAPSAAFDLRELLATLHRHAVDYTVIGDVAVSGPRSPAHDKDLMSSPPPTSPC